MQRTIVNIRSFTVGLTSALLDAAFNHLVTLSEYSPPFTMPNKRPTYSRVLELASGKLSGVSSIGFVEYILCSDLDAAAEVLAGEE